MGEPAYELRAPKGTRSCEVDITVVNTGKRQLQFTPSGDMYDTEDNQLSFDEEGVERGRQYRGRFTANLARSRASPKGTAGTRRPRARFQVKAASRDRKVAAVARYRIVPERSQVWIEARSSLHPIHGEATGLEGELDLEYADDRLVTDPTPVMRLRMPVERLRSGNPLNDLQMRRVVAADRYPAITGEATRVEPAGERYRVTGELTFHGVRRTVSDEVTVIADRDELVIEGRHKFDITDFGVRPPKILMLRVHPEVTVRIRAVAKQLVDE